MFDFLKSFTSPNSYLGVDIGTNSIKIVEIERTSGKPRLINYGMLENFGYLARQNEAIQTSSLSLSVQETARLLKILCERSNFKTNYVIASIPAFASFITFMEVPEMPEGDMLNALKYQIPKYIPLPVDETNIDWLQVGQTKDENGFIKQQILLTAVPKEKVSKYQEVFKVAGLNLKMLEVESLSLVRAVAAHTEEPVIVVDIGSRSTNIVVVDKGYVRYSSQADYAGLSLTQAIAHGLGIDMKRGEELKKQRGIIVRQEEYELSTLTLPFIDAILSDIERAKSAYDKGVAQPVTAVLLAGGGANLLGLPKYIEDQVGLKAAIANPFSNLDYPQEISLVEKEIGPSLAVAIGLGIKEFI